MKHVHVKFILTLIKKIIIKHLNLKLVVMCKCQNIKTFLQMVTLKIGSTKFFLIKKVKNTVPWTYSIEDLNEENFIGTICKKDLQKKSKIIYDRKSNQEKR